MLRGVVKWFEDVKGYGFIRSEGIGEDIFVFYGDIIMGGYKTLQTDDLVEFQIKRHKKGFKAVNVVPVPTANTPSVPSA